LILLAVGGWFAWDQFASLTHQPDAPTPTVVAKTPADHARDVVNEYYDDINQKNYEAAWALVGSPMREVYTATSFRQGYEATSKIDVTISEVIPEGDEVLVKTFLLTQERDVYGNPIQKKFSWNATVRQVNNAWKIVSADQQEL
jgi:DUF971 family protein